MDLSNKFCHFRGVRSFHFYSILMENPVADNIDPDLMPHDLGLRCLPMTLLQVPR